MSSKSEDGGSKMASGDQTDSQSIDHEGSCGCSFPGCGTDIKKGPWTAAEDELLIAYVNKHGKGNWNQVQKRTGLTRCGKSCRLRWANHLRPDLKKGNFSPEEERLIIALHSKLGNKWARIALHLPGRTDNEIKNFWNTRLKKLTRARLPIYPPELVHQQSLNENQPDSHKGGLDSIRDELLLSQYNNFGPLGITFDGYKPDQSAFSGSSNFLNNHFSQFVSQDLDACNYSTRLLENFPKRTRLSETSSFPSYICSYGITDTLKYLGGSSETSLWPGPSLPYDPDPGSESLPSLPTTITGSHTLLNGNFSTSPSPFGNVKLELPSLQFPMQDSSGLLASIPLSHLEETRLGSPRSTESVKYEFASYGNNGLLETLLDESRALSKLKSQLPSNTSSSSIALSPCNTDREASNPASPLGWSACSILRETSNHFDSGCSLEEKPYNVTSMDGAHVKLESDEILQNFSTEKDRRHWDLSRPDVLLSHGWCPSGTKDSDVPDPDNCWLNEFFSD